MENPTATSISAESTAATKWRRWLIPLVVIVLFAAGILHFARLQWHRLPVEDRVNNGSEPTFFAFHILPSFNFSEDFYLYYVRAKRISERGWCDSLFYSRPEQQANLAAPVQVGLSKLAIMTDGRPIPYSLYMFAILATAWMALYAAARAWLPANVRTASILVTVLVTVLFEAAHYLFAQPEFPTFGQWPMFRGLRMSTMAWTNPLLVAVLLCITSLAVDRQRWGARIIFLFGMLLLLAGADNWTFGLAWIASGLMLTWITAAVGIGRWRSGQWPISGRVTVCSLAVVIASIYLIHQQFNGSLQGDTLLRAGLGPDWTKSERPATNVPILRTWFLRQGLAPIAISLFGSLLIFRPTGASRMPLRLKFRINDAFNMQVRLLAVLPVVSMYVLYELLKRQGMEPFLRNQLFWRVNYCGLFVLMITTLEWWRDVLSFTLSKAATNQSSTTPSGKAQKAPARLSRLRDASLAICPKSWAAAMAVGIAVLFAYHNYRLYDFVGNVAARHFFLTADAERLRPWLEEYERQHGKFDLATASLELNYLAAFWTNADLLLPSGFPYHNGADNAEIRERALQVLRLYNATPESWQKVTAPLPGRFQESWLSESRVNSSGEAYLYHFYHRWVTYDRADAPKWRHQEDMRVRSALKRLQKSDATATANGTPPEALVHRPQVILVDEVSRNLGSPDLTDYELGFRSGSIEAWVRRTASSTAMKNDSTTVK